MMQGRTSRHGLATKGSGSPPIRHDALQDNEEFMADDDEGPNCFSFQYYGGDDAVNDDDEYGGERPPSRAVNVSPKHCSGGNNFESTVDNDIVKIGTSSIMEMEGRPVGYNDESFIAASANQHEETMFDDDITSALLNGINSNAVQNTSSQFNTTTPREAIEHSITATDGSLNQSLTGLPPPNQQ